MTSGGIFINHAGLNGAIDEMSQVNRQMIQAMDELEQTLSTITFTGNSATAWRDLQNTINQASAAMNSDFGSGANILSNMHDIHIQSDLKGATYFQGY